MNGLQLRFAKEKQLTRERVALAAERRQLPWVKGERIMLSIQPADSRPVQ
jgi:hypothetical protein